MEPAEVVKKIDELSERMRRYMSAAESNHANDLFLVGVKSALEAMARHIHKTDGEVEKLIMVIGEMRAVCGETNAWVRMLRNHIFYSKEEIKEIEEIGNVAEK